MSHVKIIVFSMNNIKPNNNNYYYSTNIVKSQFRCVTCDSTKAAVKQKQSVTLISYYHCNAALKQFC